jgi:hypothetical protein
MWVDVIVILDAPADLPEHCLGVQQGSDAQITSLKV